MGVLAAERIKLTSTRSPWWCSAVVVALGLGLAALIAVIARTAKDSADAVPMDVAVAVGGVSGFGVMVLMIMATLSVTSEYRFGIIRTTFLATPQRSTVIVVKTALLAVYGALLTAVLCVGALLISRAIYGTSPTLDLSTGAQWRALLGVPLYALFSIVLAVGVGVLVRQSAAAISIIVLWPLILEPLLGAFGSFGRNVGPLLPFSNGQRFFSLAESNANWHWGPWGSLVYFAAFVTIVFGAALVTLNKRDA
ncbi:ABC transporter permease [Nocardia otitidiscaviarum]|uniref:ABC transporter permease n=1 Tax=Nocardia otitidiscaviarum TaxID=1823 RepID=UPI0004A6AF21|nr:ABC transporter permease [Nocardia otitidiscaviarum]MBF6137931.1 ABC transporter permease [Nocardia otitidiscaviarum]MBF6488930.1 ABC transporter permease [Nocardia otitidiscaviarum]